MFLCIYIFICSIRRLQALNYILGCTAESWLLTKALCWVQMSKRGNALITDVFLICLHM